MTDSARNGQGRYAYRLQDYDYELPQERIAQHPAARREDSRLLVLDRATGRMQFTRFSAILEHVPEGALLVANNSRVVPARIQGMRPTGGRMKMLLLTPLPLLKVEPQENGWSAAEAWVLLKASKSMKAGDTASFGPDLNLSVLRVEDFGRCKVRLSWQGSLQQILEARGAMPLPPYIRRPADADDMSRYQTVYASQAHAGSVAAPTAGLHFSAELKQGLKERGVGWAEVTLYVGYGTFSPIRAVDVRDHEMHAEYVEISAESAQAINAAKDEGRPVLAVGTTSVRALEGVHQERGMIAPHAGWINIYIRPGFAFQVVDHCLTNFHLPKSSLLVMISALAGREQVLAAYAEALSQDFRFFSYGDAMLLL